MLNTDYNTTFAGSGAIGHKEFSEYLGLDWEPGQGLPNYFRTFEDKETRELVSATESFQYWLLQDLLRTDRVCKELDREFGLS